MPASCATFTNWGGPSAGGTADAALPRSHPADSAATAATTTPAPVPLTARRLPPLSLLLAELVLPLLDDVELPPLHVLERLRRLLLARPADLDLLRGCLRAQAE